MWESVSNYLIDRDGVLVQSPGCVEIPGAKEWINKLVENKRSFLIASNHTLSSPERAAKELVETGFYIEKEQIFTPLSVLREIFHKNNPGRVLVVGTGALKNFVRQQNVQTVKNGNADTVLMGFFRNVNHRTMSLVIEAISKNKARLIALHKNRLYVGQHDKMEPGLGAWVTAVEYATGIEAHIVGKPNPEYFLTALEKLGAKPENTVMISDDPTSDLSGAKKIGLKTVFVMTGKYSDARILDKIDSRLHPDTILKSIKDVPC
jgi:HAD superfamily hydrolase (TIGR01450 family)